LGVVIVSPLSKGCDYTHTSFTTLEIYPKGTSL